MAMKLSATIAGTVASVMLAGLAVAQNPATPPAAPAPPTGGSQHPTRRWLATR